MKTWLLSLSCLNASNLLTTLYFADNSYNSASKSIQCNRLKQPALLNVSPNDGGTFKLFNSASVGEIELINTDNALDYVLDYAFDGRKATLSFIDDDNTETVYLTATVTTIREGNGVLILSIKTFSESLANLVTMDNYLGTGGLEGGAAIKGKQKPLVFGVCSNITPVLVHEDKLIFQASNRSDTVVTAVYDDGIRLVNYQISSAASVGASSITVDSGSGGIASGTVLALVASGTNAVFLVTAMSTLADGEVGSVLISPPLVAAIDDNSFVEQVMFYADLTALQGNGLADTWGGYQGYFRLAVNPAGVVTCDAMSINKTLAFDVFEALSSSTVGFDFTPTVSVTNKTVINALGSVGVYVDSSKSVRELLDLIARSIGGYYWFTNEMINLGLFDVPATPVFTIIDAQILSISRSATGLGSNGVPVQGFKFGYDKIETVQTTLAGSVSKSLRSRLANPLRFAQSIRENTKSRHLLSEILSVDGVLHNRQAVFEVIYRLNQLASVRRDVIEIVAQFNQLPVFSIGDTIEIITPRLGYGAGRHFIVMGYTTDVKRKKITLKGIG